MQRTADPRKQLVTQPPTPATQGGVPWARIRVLCVVIKETQGKCAAATGQNCGRRPARRRAPQQPCAPRHHARTMASRQSPAPMRGARRPANRSTASRRRLGPQGQDRSGWDRQSAQFSNLVRPVASGSGNEAWWVSTHNEKLLPHSYQGRIGIGFRAYTMMLLMGMWTSFTKKPMKPIMKKPIAVA